MKTRLRLLVVAAAVAVAPAWLGHAQSGNGATTLIQETVPAGGGSASGAATRVFGAFAEPVSGPVTGGGRTIRVGYQSRAAWFPPGQRTISVSGSLTGPVTSVTVNGISAVITGSTYQAAGVSLVEGANTITATARDAGGASVSTSITVTLDTRPPARPTSFSAPTLAPSSTHTLSGTKTPGTSIWVNGAQRVALDTATTWSASVSLVEGDNVFTVVAKDAAGNASSTFSAVVVRDTQPPVITATAPAKTNLSPFPLSGTVDDSLTTVTVGSVTATRAGTSFQADVPLALGSNTLTIRAVSPNGFVSTKTLAILRGSVPTLGTVTPATGAKAIAETPLTIQAAATDADGDPIQYQLVVDGQPLGGWQAGGTFAWTPAPAQVGPRTVEVRAQDGFGGYASKAVDVYVVYRPVPPQ
jgi:hypothetical protein